MREIECPNCGKTFQVDESAYQSIVASVRTKEFNAELQQRLDDARQQFEAAQQAMRLQTEKDFEQRMATRGRELDKLQMEITRLSGIIDGHEAAKRSELAELESKKNNELHEAIARMAAEIANLKAEIAAKDSEHKLSIIDERSAGREALMRKQQEVAELQAELRQDKLAAENREAQLRELHKQQLLDKQAEIDRLKDFKLRLSTKMVGESLEQHCSTEFARAQSMGMFPQAVFAKDNTAVEHSKGDFIFRDYVDGREYVSIMFEMKNEMDATATKHRNDDFLDKLDKDRTRKGCEYAVLVSMLEQDNELYNNGIVDKSHRYEKMLVIRPQFFLPLLRLLTEATKKGYLEKASLVRELEAARSQSHDFSKFEERINKFRTAFNSNVAAAHKKFVAATEGIDKTIDALEKQIKNLRAVKASFEASEQRLLKANELAEEDLTVKKLTHGAPSVRRMIEDAGGQQQ